jgi:acyl-CoA thioesterase I
MGGSQCGSLLTRIFALLCLTGSAQADAVHVRIVLFGDSYISSYGVEAESKFRAQLEVALNVSGSDVQVVDTGFTKTSVSGAARLESLLEAEEILGGTGPKAVILELGQNDCRTFTLEETEAGLNAILKALADHSIPVLVVGTIPYEACNLREGQDYNADYVQMFADLAAKHGDLYYRDFKAGLEDRPELLHTDHDHPRAEGLTVIVANMLPVVKELVARANQP